MRRKGFSPSSSLSGFAAAIFLAILASSFAFSQTSSVVYRFKGGDDGTNPYSTLLADKAGNLYGTTMWGGGSSNCGIVHGAPLGCGIIFELSLSASTGRWSEAVLYAFTGLADGKEPTGGLAFDQKGNLYGTTVFGGVGGYGTVFQLTPPTSGGAWTFNVLHNLGGYNNGYPIYPLVDTYGIVYFEEPGGGSLGLGAVSQLSPPATAGGAWLYKELYSFEHPPDGFLPIGTLILDKDGNLYGVTANGGTGSGEYGGGTVFELVRPATHGGVWAEYILYSFQGAPDGQGPYSGVIRDPAGNLYGTTQQGGVYGPVYGGYGTVYELSPPAETGGAWTEAILYSFQGAATDGRGPRDALVRDNHGNLYGTTITPTVFELSPPAVAGGSWTETTLNDFPLAKDGANAIFAGLTFRVPGKLTLNGATTAGGTENNGVIFSVTP
jgi:uncharacterized repeat protein (TIGR03803 family)